MLNTQVGVSRYTGYTVFPAHERIHTEDTVEYSDRYTLHFALERSYRKNIREANLANLVTSLATQKSKTRLRPGCDLSACALCGCRAIVPRFAMPPVFNPNPTRASRSADQLPSAHQEYTQNTVFLLHFGIQSWPGVKKPCLLYTSDAADE